MFSNNHSSPLNELYVLFKLTFPCDGGMYINLIMILSYRNRGGSNNSSNSSSSSSSRF